MGNEKARMYNFKPSDWSIDTGATSHVTNNRSCFSSFTHIAPHKVELGNWAFPTAFRKSDVILKLNANGQLSVCTLKSVFFIPESGLQLISIRILDKVRSKTQFGNNLVTLSKKGIIFARGSLTSANLYTHDLYRSNLFSETALKASLWLFHNRLAHVSLAGNKQMIEKNDVKGVKISRVRLM